MLTAAGPSLNIVAGNAALADSKGETDAQARQPARGPLRARAVCFCLAAGSARFRAWRQALFPGWPNCIDALRRNDKRSADRRIRAERPRLRDRAVRLVPAHRRRTAPAGDLHELPGSGGSDPGRRLRPALRAGFARDRSCRQPAGANSRHRDPGPLARPQPPRRRRGGGHDHGADPGHLRSGKGLHRGRTLLRLARRLWRDRDGRGMGPQAWLRGCLYGQGHRHRRARSAQRHRQPAARRPRPGTRSGIAVELHGTDRRRRARGIRRESPQSVRLQARAFGGQSGSGLGSVRAPGGAVRVPTS